MPAPASGSGRTWAGSGRQPLAAVSTAAVQHQTATNGGHAGTEAVTALADDLARLEGTLRHGSTSPRRGDRKPAGAGLPERSPEASSRTGLRASRSSARTVATGPVRRTCRAGPHWRAPHVASPGGHGHRSDGAGVIPSSRRLIGGSGGQVNAAPPGIGANAPQTGHFAALGAGPLSRGNRPADLPDREDSQSSGPECAADAPGRDLKRPPFSPCLRDGCGAIGATRDSVRR